MTCREHCDASVDLESTRDEALVPVPFIKLCPNSWLVPPTGDPIRISEADQFSPAKIRTQVDALRKTLGATVTSAHADQVKNALGQAEAATDDDAWGKALQALAGLATFVPKPHAALQALVATRLAQINEPVVWALEELDEGDEPLAQRRTGIQALLKRVDVAVFGKRLPVVETLKAWLKKHTP